jgi:uncharacterized circularly permuted ATP-grasp superfamily protein
MHGLDVPGGVYAHIAGIDLVRVSESDFYVLEDNLRAPSGVSYMLENRAIMMRLFPELFDGNAVAPVDHYPEELLRNLRAVAPRGIGEPTVALLTPGAFNRLTVLISNMPIWPTRWVSNLSKHRIFSSEITRCSCGPPKARSVSM